MASLKPFSLGRCVSVLFWFSFWEWQSIMFVVQENRFLWTFANLVVFHMGIALIFFLIIEHSVFVAKGSLFSFFFLLNALFRMQLCLYVDVVFGRSGKNDILTLTVFCVSFDINMLKLQFSVQLAYECNNLYDQLQLNVSAPL